MSIGKLLTSVVVISISLFLPHQLEALAIKTDERGYRLPNNTVPLHYDISLRTNIHGGDFMFDGRVQIHIKIVEDSDTITLHYRQLVIRNVNILDVDGSVRQQNVRFIMTHPLEFLDILPQTPLTADDELIVDISYIGILRDDGAGFIRSSYANPDTSEIIWLASVQFKNTDARHAVPCYDEIKYRSTMQLRIEHHESYNAVSNTPSEEQIRSDDDGFVTTIFAKTPSMPTNLLTFSISNFAHTTVVNEFNVTMSSYAQPTAVARGETEFSLTWGQQVFRHLNNLFGDYTLPKLDQIAIPDLEWSTEPSWGLISFRESLLLHTANATPEETTARELRIAHVFTHNYFGNLVSPVWWTFLWMNEGFATLYEKYIVDSINGPSDQYELFMLTTKDEVMSLDVNGALVPLNHYVESPSEINDKAYDVIVTHYKAAFVLFMARTMLQQITFEKGVRYYLTERAFNSATPDDLHSGLQRSYDEDNPGNGVDIAEIMWPWQNIRGYPVVTVSIEGDILTLKQEGFQTPHDELYGIPIAIATASSRNFSYPLQQIYWMTSREMQISLSDSIIDWVENDWIVVNVRNFAYYVTNYDDNLWNLLIEALVNEPENIHFENRGALFANFHLFIEHAHDVSSTIFLRLAEFLQVENEVTVWRRADRGLLRIGSRLRGTELFQGHETYLRNLFAPIYERLLNDEDFNTQLVDLVRFWSCTSGIQECLDRAIDELYDTTVELSMCPGFITANATVLTSFWSTALMDPLNADPLLNDLACTNDLNFLSVYLNSALELSNNFTRAQRTTIINRTYSANHVGFNLIRDFFGNNYDFIHTERGAGHTFHKAVYFGITPKNTALTFHTSKMHSCEVTDDLHMYGNTGSSFMIMDIGEYLANIAAFANTQTEIEWVTDLSALIPPTSAVGAEAIDALLSTNIRWYERNIDELREFYSSF